MKKKTVVLLTLFAGLLLVVLVSHFWPKSGDISEMKIVGWGGGKKVDKSEEEGPIEQIEIQIGKEKSILSRGEKNKWVMNPPEGARADPYKVRQIVDMFNDDLVSVIGSRLTPNDEPAFGLDEENRISIALYKSGVAVVKLEIGKVQKPEEGYGEGDTFVRLPGEMKAYRIIQRDLRRPFEDGIKGLRERKIFDFESDDIQEIVLKNPSATMPIDRLIELASDEGKKPEGEGDKDKKPQRVWRIVKPEGFKAGEVRSFASTIAGLYAQEYLDNPPEGVNFDTESAVLDVKLTDGKKITIQVSKNKDDYCYLKIDGVPGIVKVSKYTGDSLRKRVSDLRDKSIFNLSKDDIQRVEITQGNQRLSIVKEKGEYRMLVPSGIPVGKMQADSLFSDIETLKADTYPESWKEAETGFDKPKIIVDVYLKDGGVRSLIVGNETGSGSYAKLANSNEVFTIASWMLSRIKKNPMEFRNKKVFDFEASAMKEVELVHKDETVRLVSEEEGEEKKEVVWKALSPQMDSNLKKDTVNTLVNTLAGLMVKDFVPEKKIKDVELDKSPELVVTVTLKDGTKHTIKISSQKKDGDPFATSTTENDFKGVVFTLNQYQVKNFQKRLAELK